MDTALIIGILGTFILVFTFILNEHHKLTVDDLTFDVLHLFGSLFLVFYAIDAEIYIFVVLNGIAAFVSLSDVVKGLMGKPKAKTKSAIIRQKRREHKRSFLSYIFWSKKNKKEEDQN